VIGLEEVHNRRKSTDTGGLYSKAVGFIAQSQFTTGLDDDIV